MHPIFVKTKKIDELRDVISKVFNDNINDSDIIYLKKQLKYFLNKNAEQKFIEKIRLKRYTRMLVRKRVILYPL